MVLESKEKLKKFDVACLKDQLEGTPNGQIWDNLSNKVNNILFDYNPENKTHIHI